MCAFSVTHAHTHAFSAKLFVENDRQTWKCLPKHTFPPPRLLSEMRGTHPKAHPSVQALSNKPGPAKEESTPLQSGIYFVWDQTN